MQKGIIISTFISLLLIGGTLYFISKSPTSSNGVTELNNVEVKDGVQYVTVLAKAGYSPRLSQIKSGIPTKLIVKTNGTYDCSASLVIRTVGFQKILKPVGEEVIDLGTPKSGDRLQGVCGMGMYNFQIQAS